MNYTQVSYGSQGDEVKKLQELLNSNGAQLDVDGVFGDKTQQAVKNYQSSNNLEVDGIVGKNTWGALTKNATTSTPTTETPTTENPTETKAPTFEYGAYEKSDVVKQAEALLQQQLANKPGAYQSTWQDQLNETLNQILNREKFSYDLNGDMLYNQYKDQYTTQGKMAKMDTMGQAAALTGGYGNSYAQQAGQQTYQGYLQQLNDRIPELYQLALDQYNREGDDMYNQASIMASMEDQAYGRYRDQLSDYNAELGRLAEEARYQGELDYNKWADSADRAYQMYLNDQQSASGYYDRLVTMITTLGYTPTDEELAQAGMSKAQYESYKSYYDKQNPTTTTSSSGRKGWDNGGLATEAIKKLQALVGLEPDGKWGPNSRAAAQAAYGISDPVELYKSLWGKGTPATTTLTDYSNVNKFESKLHSESEHDAVMRDMYGSYKQYVAEQIENSGLTTGEKAYLIALYGIQESDTNYKPKK